MADWDLAAALEASARAAAVGGDFDAAEDFAARARVAWQPLPTTRTASVVESDLATLPQRP